MQLQVYFSAALPCPPHPHPHSYSAPHGKTGERQVVAAGNSTPWHRVGRVARYQLVSHAVASTSNLATSHLLFSTTSHQRSSSTDPIATMSETSGSQAPPALPSIYSSCNGKLLLAAVVCLALVVSFVLLLHIYARCFLRPRRRDPLDVEGHFFVRRGRRSIRVEALSTGYLGAAVFFAAASDGGGLDAAAISSLPEFVYRKEAGKEEGGVSNQGGNKSGNWLPPPECAVCLSEMEDGEAGRELPGCGHRFHVECIDTWLAARPTCPVCRAAVKVPDESKGELGSATVSQDQGNTPVVAEVEEAPANGMRLGGSPDEVAEGRMSTSCALGSDPTIQLVIEPAPPVNTCSSSTYTSSSSSSSSTSSSTSSSPSTSTASAATTSLGCSLKRILSRSKSDSRKVFPSAANGVSGGEL